MGLKVTNFSYWNINPYLDVGANEIMRVETTPEKGMPVQSEVWTSSDPKVATVDENGKITGVSVGTAVISIDMAFYTGGE